MKLTKQQRDWRQAREELPCEKCGTVRRKRSVHEIANGNSRQAALDKPYATLVLCESDPRDGTVGCHPLTQIESEARQLARLYFARPHEFNLQKYNELVNPRAPRRIEQWEIDREADLLLGQEPERTE